MSFQIRVLSLVMFVAVAATAATAWLTFELASAYLAESESADGQKRDKIVRALSEHALKNGGWTGVTRQTSELARATDRRIRLTTESGQVLVDTDRHAAPGRLTSPTARVDTRPRLTFNALEGNQAQTITALEIRGFRGGVRLAACLTGKGFPVDVASGPNGVPRLSAGRIEGGIPANDEFDCQFASRSSSDELRQDIERIYACGHADNASTPVRDCLAKAFVERTDDVTAEPVLVYVADNGSGKLPASPIVAAAVLVMVLAATGTALLSRRMLRPIRALTAASRQLAGGDLSNRVEVHGHDQVAELSRSFNDMATALQEGEERQRQMVADVAHELRTPLSNLRGYLEGLTDGVIPPDPELFASLQEETMLQQRIIDDLRQLALAEAGTLSYHRVILDLAELVETCRVAHRRGADAAGIRLTVRTDGPLLVDGDPDRLRQVISNLVSNAVRYTGAGGSVELRATREGTMASVTVCDTGSGISEEDLPKIFDRLWRADSARSRVTGGSGLGLSIARQITVDHGGFISVASELGVGTTFTVVLPLAAAGTGPTITVVDRPADRQVVGAVVERRAGVNR